MVTNKKIGKRVKFISYTGKYPCLCNGVLTLEIDGKEYKFGHVLSKQKFDNEKGWVNTDEDPNNPNFERFWNSGGSITCDGDCNCEINRSEWEIDARKIPEQFIALIDEIDEVFNENVQHGCCGGCA